MRTKSQVECDIMEVQKNLTEAKCNMQTHQYEIEHLEEEVCNMERELMDLDKELQAIKRSMPVLRVGDVVEMNLCRYLVYTDGSYPYHYQLLFLKGDSSYFSTGCWNSHTQKIFTGMNQMKQFSNYVYDHGGTYLGKFCDLYEEKN